MKQSKYYSKAIEIYKSTIKHNAYTQFDLFQKDVLKAMCQLAEEVEYKLRTCMPDVLEVLTNNLYTKEQVEELLQKQRQLSFNKAKVKESKRSGELGIISPIIRKPVMVYTVDKDSILNAKLKLDEKH